MIQANHMDWIGVENISNIFQHSTIFLFFFFLAARTIAGGEHLENFNLFLHDAIV